MNLRRAIYSILLLAMSLAPAFAQEGAGRGGQSSGAAAPGAVPARIPTIEERTNGMQKQDGYFPVYWDERAGNLYLEIARFNSEFLYTTGLAAGLGSNDLGLDRGQQGQGKVVTFQREQPARS